MEEIINYIVNNKLDVLGTLLGFLYLLLEFKESIWMWVVGCIMPAIYIVVLYQAGIYADCGMEVYYFLAGVYGIYYWLRGTPPRGSGEGALTITHTPPTLWLPLLGITALLYALLVVFLIYCTDSRVPYIDALTTALSIVGMWMLSRKYIEQWGVWFIVDLLSTALYIYKGVYGRSILYGIYTLMAIYGYMVWRKKLQ